jgi:hypothetical protein
MEWKAHRGTLSLPEAGQRSRTPTECQAQGVEQVVCQLAKIQEAIPAPTDFHAGGQELFFGRVAPSLLHMKNGSFGKSGADGIGVGDVKVG